MMRTTASRVTTVARAQLVSTTRLTTAAGVASEWCSTSELRRQSLRRLRIRLPLCTLVMLASSASVSLIPVQIGSPLTRIYCA